MNPFATPWRRRAISFVVLGALLTGSTAASADDSTIIQISKSTIYGGLLGLLLGSAVAIVVEEDRDEPIRWGLVIGVFGGFAYGVYAASTGRDDFFLREGSAPAMPGRYLLPRNGGAAQASHRGPTPLRGTARAEFSPYAASTETLADESASGARPAATTHP